MTHDELVEAVKLLTALVEELARRGHQHLYGDIDPLDIVDYQGAIVDDQLKRLIEIVTGDQP